MAARAKSLSLVRNSVLPFWPPGWSRLAIWDGGRAGEPSSRMTWHPTLTCGPSDAAAVTASSKAPAVAISVVDDTRPFCVASTMARLMPRVMPKSSAFTISLRTNLSVASKEKWPAAADHDRFETLNYFGAADFTSSVSMVMVISSPTAGLVPTPKSLRLILVVPDAPT